MVPAVILAAGMGSRLSGGKIPKAIMRFLGLSFMERTILTCRRAGVREFYVVVGYRMEEVKKHALELKEKHNLDLKVIENPNWEEGNGTSVIAAWKEVKGPFLLLMCDHLFSVDTVREFLEKTKGSEKTVLAIDKRIDEIFDLDDATKLRLQDGKAVSIGKDLEDYNAIDMGLFYATPSLPRAIEEARRRGVKCSITNGVKVLIEKGDLEVLDMGKGFWIDLDTPEALEFAKEKLLKSLGKPEDGFISYYINRRISTRITERLVEREISPNAISIFSFLICLLGAYLLSINAFLTTFLAGFLIQFSSILDGCDGEVARLKLLASPYGGWLDTVLDRYADAAVVAGAVYPQYVITKSPMIPLIGIFVVLGFILTSYTRKEYTIRFGQEFPSNLIYRLGKRDFRLFGVFIGSLLGEAYSAVILLGALSHALVLTKLLHLKSRS